MSAVGAVALVAGCSSQPAPTAASPASSAAAEGLGASRSGGELDPTRWPLDLGSGDCPDGDTSLYDPFDFLQLDGRLYQGSSGQLGPPSTAKLGRVVLTTRCRLSKGAPGPGYTFRTGDAAFVPAGTEVHELVGFDPALRVAARVDGELLVFEGPPRQSATTGAEAFPGLVEHVESVVLIGGQWGQTVLARVQDPAQVARLGRQLADAPWTPPENRAGFDVLLELRLDDGSSMSMTYERRLGRIDGGLVLPAAARQELEAAIRTSQGQPDPTCIAIPGDYQGPRDAETYVGLPEAQAQQQARRDERTLRVVGRDGRCSGPGVRSNEDRINVDVREGIVRDAARY